MTLPPAVKKHERELIAAIKTHMWPMLWMADVVSALQDRGVSKAQISQHARTQPRTRWRSLPEAIRVLQVTGLHDFTEDADVIARMRMSSEELAALKPLSRPGVDSLVGELFVTPTARKAGPKPVSSFQLRQRVIDRGLDVFADCSEAEIGMFVEFQDEVGRDVLAHGQTAGMFFELCRLIADCRRIADAGVPDESLPQLRHRIQKRLGTARLRQWPRLSAVAVDVLEHTAGLGPPLSAMP